MTTPECCTPQLILRLLFLSGLYACTASPGAGALRTPEIAASLRVACAPDKPLAHPGELVVLRAWVTDASGNPVGRSVQFSWSTSTGTVSGGDVATWSVGKTIEGSRPVSKATASVTATNPGLGQAACELLLYIANAPVTPGPPGNDRSAGLGGRAFLLPDSGEPPGYGLSSYLLFATPPKDDRERERYLKAIESYLLVLRAIEEMELHRRRSELNIIMLPVRRDIELPNNLSDPQQATGSAQRVLANYDYARAQVLLFSFGKSGASSGPYLVSRMPMHAAGEDASLFFDMSHVVPKLVWDWIRAFCSLSAQEHSWTDVTLTKLALNTRNVIAVGAREMPDVITSLQNWVQVTTSR